VRAAKSVVVGLLATAISATHAAEGSRTLLKRAGSSPFSIEVPEDWQVVDADCIACYQLGNQLFYLVPSMANPRTRITVVYYPGKVPIAAQRYIEGLTYDGNLELPRIDGARTWVLFGKHGKRDGKIGTAYYQIGGGTLVMDLSTAADEQTEKALVTALRSFKELEEAR
jgi:hypothetical protein